MPLGRHVSLAIVTLSVIECHGLICCEGLVCRAGNVSCSSAAELTRRAYTLVIPAYAEFDKASVSVSVRAQNRNKLGQSFTVVHVGPNTLSMEQQTKWLYNWMVQTYIRRGFLFEFVFIEPNANVLDALRLQLEGYGIDSNRSTVITAAVCATGQDEQRYYAFSKDILPHFPGLRRAHIDSWGGLDVQNPLVAISWDQNPLHLSVAEQFLHDMPVRCLTPGQALIDAHLKAEAIDMLVVDTPGAVKLLSLYLSLDGFQPAYIRFHWLWGYPSRLSAGFAAGTLLVVLRTLASKGYDVYHSREFFIAASSDRD